MTRLLALALLAYLTACGEPPERIKFSLEVCWEEEQAQALAAWPMGMQLALVPDEGYPCAPELAQATAYWQKLGREFYPPGEADVLIPVSFSADLQPAGLTDAVYDPMLGVMHEASIQTRTCDPYVLAHEIGHALGFLVHATREGALMRADSPGKDVSDVEMRRLQEREEEPAAMACHENAVW